MRVRERVSSRDTHFALFAVRQVISSARESNEALRASSLTFLFSFSLLFFLCRGASWQSRDPIAREFHPTDRLGTGRLLPGIGNPESLNSRAQKARERACERSFREHARPYGVFGIANSFLLRRDRDCLGGG